MQHASLPIALLIAVVLTFATGCSTPIANLTIASTKNVDLSAKHRMLGRVKAESHGRGWLLFIPLGGKPTIDAAMNKMLEKNDGDFATNVKVIDVGWSILVFSYGGIKVEGDVWKSSTSETY